MADMFVDADTYTKTLAATDAARTDADTLSHTRLRLYTRGVKRLFDLALPS